MYRCPSSILIFLFFLISGVASGQRLLVSEAKNKELATLSVQLQDVYSANRQRAVSLAQQHGWPVARASKDGSLQTLQGVTPLGFPVYLKTHNNIIAAASTNTTAVQTGGSLGLNLSGSSANLANKLAMWDGGSVRATHQEFTGKTVTLKETNIELSAHSTHVAGTLVARGTYAPAKGMAFGATTLISYDYNNDIAEMTAAASTLLLSNHSYGYISGWNYNDDEGRWEWYGLPGDTEDYSFGFYDGRAQAWDRIAYNAPYYLIVESAGNSRVYNGPAVGQTYWGYKSRTDQTFINKGPRPAGISSNNGYDIISTSGTAKNILTVGSVNQLPSGPSTRESVVNSTFSGWGPTDDGRIKPDICGMGVNVTSTTSNTNTSYGTMSGTSMSAPNVTGSLLLLQEYYASVKAGTFMKSATLKGLACHTAFDAGNIGPDYVYGWGLLNTGKAAQAITDNGTKSVINENSLTQGQSQKLNVAASGTEPLIVTIAWTDPQATLSAEGTINDRTPKLINDLDIRISNGSSTFAPWVLNPETPAFAATKGDNIRDNIEQVYIDAPVTGGIYTITVSHKNTLQSGKQDYSLIATGITGIVTTPVNPDPDAGVGFTVYPVPTHKEINVIFTAATATDMSLSLVNTAGQTVYNEKRSITAGNFTDVIDAGNYPAGTYVLLLKLGSKTYSKKVTVIK